MGFKSHLNSPQLIELLVEVDTRRIELSSIIPKISPCQSILRQYNRECIKESIHSVHLLSSYYHFSFRSKSSQISRRRRIMRPQNIIAIMGILSAGAVDAQFNGERSDTRYIARVLLTGAPSWGGRGLVLTLSSSSSPQSPPYNIIYNASHYQHDERHRNRRRVTLPRVPRRPDREREHRHPPPGGERDRMRSSARPGIGGGELGGVRSDAPRGGILLPPRGILPVRRVRRGHHRRVDVVRGGGIVEDVRRPRRR